MRSKCSVLFIVLFLVFQSSLPPASAQTPPQATQSLEPIINRMRTALRLSEQQAADVRAVFDKHAAKIAELRSRAQMNPYNPQLPREVNEEQQAIREEIAAFLDDGQKGKLPTVDIRLPVPIAPPFVTVNIPPRTRADSGPANLWGRGSGEALIPSPGPNDARTRNSRLTEDQKILHLLNRITFGPRPGDIDRVRRMGIAKFIEEQLNPESMDDSDLSKRLAALPTQQMSAAELYQFYPPPSQIEQRLQQPNSPPIYGRPQQVVGEMVQQKLVRAVSSNRQLQEVMTDFWFNHFNVFAQKEADQWLTSSYERDAIRPRVFGKFRDLLLAVAQSPAMLYYLDNWLSFAPDAKEPRPLRPLRASAMEGAPPAPPAIKPDDQTHAPSMSGLPSGERKSIDDAELKARIREPQSSTRPRMEAEGRQTARRSSMPNSQPPRPPKRKRDINENYARELLELHTMGVDGGYTQKDVQEVARCFTGWTIDRPFQGGSFVFRPWMHDQGPKTVVGVTIPAGGGMSDGLRVIEILSRHPATARLISKQLCQRFVSDDPPPHLVARVAEVYLKTDGDVREVLKTILASPEFNSAAAYQTKVKSPLELAASAIRALDGDTDGGPALHNWLRKMGEPLYQYQFPTGYGEKSSTWVNTGVFFNRINFAVAMAGNQIGGVRYEPSRLVSPDASPDEAIKQLTALLIHTALSPESLKAVQTGFTSRASRPGDLNKHLLALLLGAAEFQRK